jgi:hypothetical protein
MDPDTFTVSATALGSKNKARISALQSANKYCNELRKEILALNIKTETLSGGVGSADVTFRCLLQGDTELVRPKYQSQ